MKRVILGDESSTGPIKMAVLYIYILPVSEDWGEDRHEEKM